MTKAKLIAISGLCCAVVVGCMLLACLPVMRYLMLFLGVVAAVATVIPLMLGSKNLAYSLLIYAAGSILGVFLGFANIMYVAPIVTFCIPFAIVKVHGETAKLSATVSKSVLDDPFDDSQKVVKIQMKSKTNLSVGVRWTLYYVLLEVGLALTVLSAYLFMRPVFDAMVQNVWFYVALVVMQFAVFPYNFLLHGCLVGTAKVLSKVIKP